MQNAIIQVRHLSHTYAARSAAALRRPALIDINLEVAAASCTAIIGVTGSGKSTLVQHFNGLLLPTSGSVIVAGIDVGEPGINLTHLRRRVGMLFQSPESQLFERTIYDDVAFGPRRMQLERREIRARVLQALAQVGLPAHEYGRRAPFELSGGQQRRVALAGVLAMQPRILILDEPGVGLDAEGRAEFYACIQALRREQITVVLISHDMAEVGALAEQLFVLHQGHLVMQGAPHTLFAQTSTLREYGLVPPALSSLLARLRELDVPVPLEVTTLDAAFDFLYARKLRAGLPAVVDARMECK